MTEYLTASEWLSAMKLERDKDPTLTLSNSGGGFSGQDEILGFIGEGGHWHVIDASLYYETEDEAPKEHKQILRRLEQEAEIKELKNRVKSARAALDWAELALEKKLQEVRDHGSR